MPHALLIPRRWVDSFLPTSGTDRSVSKGAQVLVAGRVLADQVFRPRCFEKSVSFFPTIWLVGLWETMEGSVPGQVP